MQLLRLLLLVLKTAEGAAAQLDDHLRLLGNVPLSPVPRAIACDHQGWLALQLSAAAELVAASGIPLSGLPSQLHPAQLYLAAAKASLAMRRDRDAIVGECTPREGIALRLGTYLGQYELPSSTGEGLTDAEVAMFVEVRNCTRFVHALFVLRHLVPLHQL